MKLIITAANNNPQSDVDPRFGRAAWLIVHDTETGEYSAIDNSKNKSAPGGAGPQTARIVIENGASVVITGNGPGASAAEVLRQGKLKVFTGAAGMSVEQAVSAYRADKLTEFQPA